eukprot:Amastigsp_a510941_5.p4 type:complete len:129 gc:universal Amastigsp_a510941_5:428-42(-)
MLSGSSAIRFPVRMSHRSDGASASGSIRVIPLPRNATMERLAHAPSTAGIAANWFCERNKTRSLESRANDSGSELRLLLLMLSVSRVSAWSNTASGTSVSPCAEKSSETTGATARGAPAAVAMTLAAL